MAKTDNNTEMPPTWVSIQRLNQSTNPDMDAIGDLIERVENAKYPHKEEPGIVHPFNHSEFKVRNNGIIDCFVDLNQGWRLDPAEKSFNVIMNKMREHLGDFHAWIDDYAQWDINSKMAIDVRQGSYSLHTQAQQDIHAEDYINIRTDTDMMVRSDNESRFSSGSDMYISSDGDIYISSPGTIHINASQVDIQG